MPQYLPDTGRCQFKTPVQTVRAQSKCQQVNTGIVLVSGRSDVIVWQARFQCSRFRIVTKKCSCLPLQHTIIPAMSGLHTGIGVHTTGGLYIYIYIYIYISAFINSLWIRNAVHKQQTTCIALHTFHAQIFTNPNIFTVHTKPHLTLP